MIKNIHQILPTFSRWDAVSNDTLLIRDNLRELGVQSEIYHELHGEDGFTQPISRLQPYVNKQDTALLFHFSIGSDFPGAFVQFTNRKIIRYHNITPPEFFCAPAEGMIREVCARGRQQIPMLSIFCDLVLAVSQYNAQEFMSYSSTATVVLPIFRNYERLLTLNEAPDVISSIKSAGKSVVLFVGRICPNKAQHDLLKLIALYKEIFRDPIALVLVGGFFSPAFQREIEDYAQYLGLTVTHRLSELKEADIVITGSITDEQIGSLYRHSSVFCSLSDHEGFGVPLVEAMHFGLPILAQNSSAVPETLGGAACLVDKANWAETVAALHSVLHDAEIRRRCSERGKKRSLELSLSRTRSLLKNTLTDHKFLGEV